MDWVIEILDLKLMNQYSQQFSAAIASGLCIMAAKKMLNSAMQSKLSL